MIFALNPIHRCISSMITGMEMMRPNTATWIANEVTMVKSNICDTIITARHTELEIYLLRIYIHEERTSEYPCILRFEIIIKEIIIFVSRQGQKLVL